MMRVVLDANQFVSSLLAKVGPPAQALDRGLDYGG